MTSDDIPEDEIEFQEALQEELEQYIEDGTSVEGLVASMFAAAGHLLVEHLGLEAAKVALKEFYTETDEGLWLAVGEGPRLH